MQWMWIANLQLQWIEERAVNLSLQSALVKWSGIAFDNTLLVLMERHGPATIDSDVDNHTPITMPRLISETAVESAERGVEPVLISVIKTQVMHRTSTIDMAATIARPPYASRMRWRANYHEVKHHYDADVNIFH